MENTSSVMNGFQLLFNWLAKLAYLNVLWILFSLMGLILFGVGPATVSVFTIIRKWLRGNADFSMWKQFMRTFRHDFWHANGLMLFVLPVCAFIYTDFLIIRTLPSSFFIDKIVFPGVVLFTVLVLLFICYLFAVYAHFELLFFANIKYAVILAGIFPLSSIFILVLLFIFFVVLSIFPSISFFYLVSVPALIIQFRAHRDFDKVVANKTSSTNKI